MAEQSKSTNEKKNIKWAWGRAQASASAEKTSLFPIFFSAVQLFLPLSHETGKWTLVRAPIIMKSIITKINWCKFKEKAADKRNYCFTRSERTAHYTHSLAHKENNKKKYERDGGKLLELMRESFIRALAYFRCHRRSSEHLQLVLRGKWLTRASMRKDLLCFCVWARTNKKGKSKHGVILMRNFSHFYPCNAD